MRKSITSVVQRGIRSIKHRAAVYARRSSGSHLKKTVLKDGGIVWSCGVGWIAKKAEIYEAMFERENAKGITSNIFCDRMYPMKTMSRDYAVEQELHSGKWSFQNMLVIRNPYGESPLTALAIFETEKACRVRVTVKGDIPETDFVSELPMTKYHRIPILGLYPGRENRVCLELLEDNGEVAAAHVVPVWTMNLPKDLRNVIEVKKVSDQPAFQNILVSGGLGIKTCMFDRQGQIRFYIRRFAKGYGVFPLGNGHFFYMEKEVSTPTFTNPQTIQSYDMDYLGRTFMCYLTKNGVHHTAAVKAGGNIFVRWKSEKK